MANKNLFSSVSTPKAPAIRPTETVNNAGGVAYKRGKKSTLAQVAATNCFNGTYYVDAQASLKLAKEAVEALNDDPMFLAKTAIYSREKGYLKDMPAFMVAYLATLDSKLFRKVFPIVIDNGKMLRNVIQIARSGVFGKKVNVGSGAFRHAVRDWFRNHKPETIFNASVGNDPSLKDVLKMTHPSPENPEKAALYAYLLGAAFDEKTGTFTTYRKNKTTGALEVLYQHPFDKLPQIVQQYEKYKATKEGAPPKVDFRMLDSLGLGQAEWTEIARNAGWQMTRMNLNTFARHGVFANKEVADLVAKRLANPDEVRKSRAYPYQLMMAYKATGAAEESSPYSYMRGARTLRGGFGNATKVVEPKSQISTDIPKHVREALQDAMEIALENVPSIEGQVYVCVDVSGSMQSPVTGYRAGSSSQVRCLDAAALFGAAILRKNPMSEIVPFSDRVVPCTLNPRDSVLTNANKLASLPSGGTNCSEAIAHLNRNNKRGDAIIFISDNESWMDRGYYRGTGMMNEFQTFKGRNPKARLVCIDITPSGTAQSDGQRDDVLQVGGFGDQVFDVVESFIKHGNDAEHWVKVIEDVKIPD